VARRSWGLSLLFPLLGCSPAEEPSPYLPPVGTAPSAASAVPVGAPTRPDEAPPLTETVHTYLDDTEAEPLVTTGSIFANGFQGDVPDGTTPEQLAALLGLGFGDLTVLALFDRSVSMGDPWEGEPRWQAASNAFLAGLRGYESSITLGAVLFPQAAECDVAPLTDPRQLPFQSGTSFVAAWTAAPQNRFPTGGTPLGPAFERADEVITQAESYGLLASNRRFRVAVITDGRPNCGTDESRVFFLARRWRALGVEIHVIGLPGSEEARSFLDELAAIGGTGFSNAPQTSDEAEDDFVVVIK
jgi:hypothetical protein